MIRFDRKIYRPGEPLEVPKSQGLLMIKNGFAKPAKKGDFVSCQYCEKEFPKAQISEHEENCPEKSVDEDEVKPYDEWLKKELIEELEVREIEFEKSMNKSELVELLTTDDESDEDDNEELEEEDEDSEDDK